MKGKLDEEWAFCRRMQKKAAAKLIAPPPCCSRAYRLQARAHHHRNQGAPSPVSQSDGFPITTSIIFKAARSDAQISLEESAAL